MTITKFYLQSSVTGNKIYVQSRNWLGSSKQNNSTKLFTQTKDIKKHTITNKNIH